MTQVRTSPTLVGALSTTIQARVESAMRAKIAALPDGQYAHQTLAEFGLGDEDIVINTLITIDGDSMLFDYAGSSPQTKRGAVIIVPMDAKGVSRGKPLDKIGQRALNQGEIFFENVKLSKDHILAGPDQYLEAVYAVHTFANAIMGTVFVGAARAAFELALGYAHERKQGGLPIIRHQSVASRLFHMARKVEAARALAQRVVHYNFSSSQPALHAAMMAKITATQTSFEVANDALQIFCGNGLTREYPIEKIWRDARASLIEDGCNEVLAIKGGYYLIDPELL